MGEVNRRVVLMGVCGWLAAPLALAQTAAAGSGVMFGERQFIADNALRLRMPITGGTAGQTDAGFPLIYGASLHGIFRQAASHAARILEGTNPAELPIEQASTFELELNLKTAKALGVTIPQSILLRANRVIE